MWHLRKVYVLGFPETWIRLLTVTPWEGYLQECVFLYLYLTFLSFISHAPASLKSAHALRISELLFRHEILHAYTEAFIYIFKVYNKHIKQLGHYLQQNCERMYYTKEKQN